MARWLSEYEKAILEAGIPEEDLLVFNNKGMPQYNPWAKLRELEITQGNLELLDRFRFIREFGFSIPTQEALATIKKYTPILEVGAGMGYWAYEYEKLFRDFIDMDWIATDEKPPTGIKPARYDFTKQWYPVMEANALEAIAKYPKHNLLISWPDYEEAWATEALKLYQGKYFVYIGEHAGCCADDTFFEILETHWKELENVYLPQWWGVHDCLWVYERK